MFVSLSSRRVEEGWTYEWCADDAISPCVAVEDDEVALW